MITRNTMLHVSALCFKVIMMSVTSKPKLVCPPSKLILIQVHRNTGNVSIRKQTAHVRVKLAKHPIH